MVSVPQPDRAAETDGEGEAAALAVGREVTSEVGEGCGELDADLEAL